MNTQTTPTPPTRSKRSRSDGRRQETWSSGGYGKIAWLTVPLAEELCDSVDLRPGSTVLDVATGTEHVALAAARRFCDVTGVDHVSALLETARRRADAEGLAVEFREGDAESLPFGDRAYDYVLSAIGVMFIADHERAAREPFRVCRPGGVVGMVNWTPTVFVGEMLKTVGRRLPPPPGVQPAPRWGTERYVRELLGDRVSDVSFHSDAITMRFPSAEFCADFFIANYGPDAEGRRSARRRGAGRIPGRPRRSRDPHESCGSRRRGLGLGVPGSGRVPRRVNGSETCRAPQHAIGQRLPRPTDHRSDESASGGAR